MARQGDSGGPIFNPSGQLVGMILGTNGRIVTGTYCGRIRQFLSGLAPRFVQPAQQPPRSPQTGPQTPTPIPSGEPRGEEPDDEQERRTAGVLGRLSELGESIAAVRTGIAKIDSRVTNQVGQLGQCIERLTTVTGRLQRHLQTAEATFGESHLRDVVRRAVAGTVITKPFEPAGLVLPAVAAALGISAPPLVVLSGWKLLKCWLRRRRRQRGKRGARNGRRSAIKEDPDRRPAPRRDESNVTRQLNDDYAEQLHRVFANSGRSTAQDATLGREYDEQIRRAAESSDPKLADWAHKLRNQVEAKFHRIHGFEPSPAEPIQP